MLVNRAEPIYRQVALHFEKEIFEGRLKPGDKLPTTQEVAAQFGVNHETIQCGLKILADRGLIERRRKCGSFVRAAAAGKTVGIVFNRDVHGDPDMGFFNILMGKLADIALAHGWNVKHYAVSPVWRFDHATYELERDLSSGALSALINLAAGDKAGEWLEKHCLVPYFVCPIELDLDDFITQGISHLAAHGRRHPVLIFDAEHLPREAVEATLAARAVEHGMAPIPAVHAIPTQRDGHRAAREILDSGAPVDSFLVLFDNTFRGVLYQLLERGAKIPDDFALVSHANKGVEIFCHLPLTRLEFDPADFAKQVFDRIKARLEGGKERRAPVKATLILGKTCGEA